jgi:hypothetical protein
MVSLTTAFSIGSSGVRFDEKSLALKVENRLAHGVDAHVRGVGKLADIDG